MKGSRATLILLFMVVVLQGAKAQTNITLPQVSDIGFCKPYTWLFGGWVAPPRIPLLGDINGDGYADFLYASPQDKSIDVSLNGKGWKPLRGQRLISGLPQEIRAMCLGHFGGKTLDLAVLGKEGELRKALSTQSGEFPASTPLCIVNGLAGKVWLLAGKVASAGLDDILVVDSAGRAQVFDAAGAKAREYALHLPVVDAAAGDVDGDGKVELAVRTGDKVLLYRLGEKATRFDTIRAPRGQEALAMGDINADGKAEVLVDGEVFLAPDFKRTVPVAGWDKFTKPVIAMMGDVAGHGRADVVVQHEGPDYFGSAEADCNLYITYFKSDPDWDCDGLTNAEEARIGSDPLDRSTSHDGLLDGWKVHGFDGIDLKTMGCSPLHKDVLVMNLPYDSVPIDPMEKYMREQVVPFFADLPYTNLDGTKGFALHWITERPALPAKANEGKSWEQIAGETFPPDKIGLYHWMLIGGMGGGGQSDQLADSGSTGMASWCHEFGHQLGLSHSGKWDAWSPTYTSLMNYSYSYQFEGDRKKIHFSTGDLASLVLNESHLPGEVPFPEEKLAFLAGPPYHFHLKPAGPNATYVDWGWTGDFSAHKVKANITYGYGVSGGERLQPSGKQSFHYDGPFELMTDYQASLAEHRGKLYMVTANRGPVDPKAPRPKSAGLVIQTYLGKHAWTAPATISSGVTNDPYAASDGRTFYVFYPTADGVMVRFGQPDALGPAQPVPDSNGAYASAVDWKGTLLLFLYKGPDENIVYRTVRENKFGPVVDLGIRSTIPPGPAVDTLHDQLLLGTAGVLGKQAYRWQLRRFAWDTKGGFKEVSRTWVGGEKSGWAGNRRPALLFNPRREYGPQGRIYWIAAGLAQPLTTPTAFFLAQTIGYKDVNDGWLLWRYYDEWTNTRSGIGAAWYDKDIVLATTWASGTAGGDGGVFCAYNGTAIGNVNMGDFDDIALMANYGMERSIGTFARMPSVGAGK
ncbi:MAG TPA: FG-GAP-like repeat-containing protein [Chthonomonadaceae bacterium]|nr:FG-GAP-like repeat-containing protein [Chthonomonadaceae bacterium]